MRRLRAALLASGAKFESGTGWPSFAPPLDPERVELVEDRGHGRRRGEVVCRNYGSHLGHVFADGPAETGLRYCVNSLALGFAPTDEG